MFLKHTHIQFDALGKLSLSLIYTNATCSTICTAMKLNNENTKLFSTLIRQQK